MTQEEKQLLLEDLCARLPYGVKVQPSGSAIPHKFNGYDNGLVRIDIDQRYELENIKPYLRTMSSMTEEERNEATQFEISNLGPIGFNWNLLVSNSFELVNWLNAHHFDYRGLIKKGLALEAPEDMYKNE